ncbi:hypothetical protein A8H39_00780 [Paraburkholderia fungorum]|uniref:hypothetical protein n=1 Tax=Paraburkholderia fungorum TaxID=134537 RepID=UPI0004842D9E|nr:hypothetical protein [Paraburkholderia fungorum]PNE59715.1 hypothetical protein A8H39_00780 [Paraburkholderia fungorum]
MNESESGDGCHHGAAARLHQRYVDNMRSVVFEAGKSAGTTTMNPWANAPAAYLEPLLRRMCDLTNDDPESKAEIDDQIEALVPALVELRDGGYLQLHMAAAASYGTLDGFMRLAGDDRLTPLSRARCQAICNRMLARSLRALFNRFR